MKSENENNLQLNSKIIEILPQLRVQIAKQQKQKYHKKFTNQLQDLKIQLRAKYQQKLNYQAHLINNSIKQNLSQLQNSLKNKKQREAKKHELTSTEQQELIQITVEQILTDESLRQEVKRKICPKIQERVKNLLIRDVQQNAQKFKQQTKVKMQKERYSWKAERQVFWRSQSQKQVQKLAIQYEEQQQKKNIIEKSLKDKMATKLAVQKKYELLLDHSRQISNIKKQIKSLQLQIR